MNYKSRFPLLAVLFLFSPFFYSPSLFALKTYDLDAQAAPDSEPLIQFSDENIAAYLQEFGIEVGAPGGIVEDGIEARFSAGNWAGVSFGPEHFKKTDWTDYEELVFTLENRDPRETRVLVDIFGEPSPLGSYAMFEVALGPETAIHLRLPIFHLPYTQAVAFPSQEGLNGIIKASGQMNLGNITQMRFFLNPPNLERDATLWLYNIKLDKRARAKEGWIDPYGQNKNKEWPEKVRSEKALRAADEEERAELKAFQPPPDRSEYQGWKTGPARPAGGFFQVAQIDGKWWLTDPLGYRFYSTGLNVVTLGDTWARIGDEQTRKTFAWLPDRNGPFGEAISPFGVSLYIANLIRKWGENYYSLYHQRALARLRAWGFTSVGNWSAPEITTQMSGEGKFPYVSPGPDMGRMNVSKVGNMPDPYHPDFEREARRAAEPLSLLRNDSFLIGHFIENEPTAMDLPKDALAAPRDQPAKQRFLDLLRAQYQTIGNLNAAWGVSAPNFEALRWPENPNPAARQDLQGFQREFAERYYSVWYTAIKAADPNHLVLGSRFADRDLDFIEVSARYTDVVSFNHYQGGIDPEEFGLYYRLTNKPFLIGEYSFNSLDKGLFTAYVPVANDEARGTGYRYYTEQTAALPYFVGTHYFKCHDYPLPSGHDPEERWTMWNGAVPATDIPYKNLVASFKATNGRIYPIHDGQEAPYSDKPGQ